MTGFHTDALSHLARRSVEVTSGNALNDYEILQNIPLWGKAILASTIIFFTVVILSIRYTLWDIVPALAAIETPSTTVIVKEEKPKLVDALAEENIDEEVLVINHKPVTAKIRTTLHHLKARAGRLSRWRGLSVFIIFRILHNLITESLQTPLTNAGLLFYGFAGVYVARMIGSVIASILLARLTMTWTHVVISDPSSKSWFQRVPSWKSWKNVWAPTAIFDVAARLPFVVTAFAASILGLTSKPDPEGVNVCYLAGKVFLCALLGLIAFFGMAIPAFVALIRVQASMLPEDHETIVNFDRTFGGKVVPQILGGTGAISYLDAWKTFDKPARKRILKLAVKNIMIEVALHVLFSMAILCEAIAIVGSDKIRDLVQRSSA